MKTLHFFYRQTLLPLVLAALFLTPWMAQAQKRPSLDPPETKTASAPAQAVSPFEKSAAKSAFATVITDATYLTLNVETLKSSLKNSPRDMVFRIPQASGADLELLLERQEILTPDFEVTDEKGNPVNWQPGTYYTGHLVDRTGADPGLAALSITDGEVMAIVTMKGKNHVLGTLRDGTGKKTNNYVFYKDENLQIPNTFECGTNQQDHKLQNPATAAAAKSVVGKNIVRVQFEADYHMFQTFATSASVSNYVTGLFNMVATIYQKENIVTQISKIVVWNTPDPYAISSAVGSGDVLNKFRDRKNLVGINGDLAHLLSTKPVGHGGIAWIDVLCYSNIGYRTAYSNISSTFNAFPLYSWTIDVVTHEMGHNLGSPHTHDCSWGASSTQALDNCYTTSGGCPPGPAPANGGTIMSYCHLTATGKNFNLGFGAQPGNLIRSKVNAASCLQKAFLNCNSATPIYCGVPVTGNTSSGVNNVNTYGCIGWNESGKEKIFVLQTTVPGTITATLSGLSTDLDVIILDACSESNCLAEGNTTAIVNNATAGQYFIVVDGYNGAVGNFTLNVSCGGNCFATGLTSLEYIKRVTAGKIDNNSGNNYGYADFTSQKTPVQQGGSMPVTLTPGFISTPWNEYWRIWVDINHDNDFNDFGELVFSTSTGSTSVVSGTAYIPSWAQLGEARMRVAMRYGAPPDACGTFSGEVEDYTVNITPYCPSLGNTGYEFINQVTVGNLNNFSGNNGGYSDYSGLTPTNLLKEDTIAVSLLPGFVSAAYSEYWRIWIDFNKNYKFEESEIVFTGGPASSAVTGSFVIPAGAASGIARMRITMSYGGFADPCSYSFYGETEDYTVNISAFCASAGSSGLEFIQTVGLGSLVNNSGNNGGYADFSAMTTEVNLGVPVPVALVPGFASTTYKESWRIWVDLNHDLSFDASEQVFEGGPSENLVIGSFTLSDTLDAGIYGCRVSMRYGGFPDPCGNIGWGEVEDYKLVVKKGEDLSNGETGDRSSEGMNLHTTGNAGIGFSLFPNPAKTVVNISWQGAQPFAMKVVSLTGQVMMSYDGENIPSKIEVAALPAGLYLVQTVSAENRVLTQRFVKAD